MSVAKSLVSTLVGAAIKDGYIASINDPVTKYLPQLSGSAYEGVSVRDMLMMASGVKWNETYVDPRPGARYDLPDSLLRIFWPDHEPEPISRPAMAAGLAHGCRPSSG